jgi:PHD/YefM family antitoxin component YafN of YafNO toxin-antitoxin module
MIKNMKEIEAFGEHKARWITISTDEYESMKSTLEVLSDLELMEQIKESREDFKAGRFKKLQDLLKESESED